jgi:hypothetical protein
MDSDYYADMWIKYEGAELLHEHKQKLLKEKKLMNIQIIATSVETKPTAKGSYQQLEVTYKNLTYQGKVEAKKIMSFGANAAAFKTLSTAAPGSTWEVTVVKNAQGYNDWPSVVAASSEAVPAAVSTGALPKTQPGQTRSTYETPEERAQRQVYIIRQSSISSAVATLAVGSKTVKPEDVLSVAKQYENYVFDVKDPGPSGFEDMPDFDVPEVN